MMANMGFPTGGEDNQGWKLYLTSLIMILCAGIFVVARIMTRFRAAKLMADDYAIIVSLIFSIILSVTIQLAVVHGYGQHVRDLSKEEMRTCLKFFWVAQTPYKVVVCLNKISIILLYMRIFIDQRFRRLCCGALAIIGSSGVATVFATIFQCVPLERSWNKAINGTCIDSSMFWLANAILNISTDVIVLALPIREVSKLQLKLRDKIMLHSVFLLGGFVTITSILRVTAVANSVRNQQDQTWNFIQRGIWTLIEANLGIICACLIVLNQAARKFFRVVFGSSKTGSTSNFGNEYGRSGVGGSLKRNTSTFKPRQHSKLDESIDNEYNHAESCSHGSKGGGEAIWADNKSYQMTTIAYHGTSGSGRKSDEIHIISTKGAKTESRESSMESINAPSGWPMGQSLGITKKVDVQVDSQPRSAGVQ